MTPLFTLARNEWLKTRKRRAFLVAVALLAGLDLLGFGNELRIALRRGSGSFRLPGEWAQILGESSQLPVVFTAVVVILLVASEFSWRTARQNVIDGLSRSDWYWGKVLAAIGVAGLFSAVHVTIGGALAAYGTPAGTPGMLTPVHVAAMGGLFLSCVGYAASGLLVASLVRSTGGAMAIWFFYSQIAETLLRLLIPRLWSAAGPYMEYAPIAALNRARNYLVYDAAALERAQDRASRSADAVRQGLPNLGGDPGEVVGVALAWTLAFIVGGWLVFRRRDL